MDRIPMHSGKVLNSNWSYLGFYLTILPFSVLGKQVCFYIIPLILPVKGCISIFKQSTGFYSAVKKKNRSEFPTSSVIHSRS